MRRVTLGVAALVIAAGCATTPEPYDPYQIPREELHARADTLALAPLRVGDVVGDRDALSPQIERLATERLEAGGWTVIPMETMAHIWNRVAEDVGPVFDPKTGVMDEERWNVTRDLVFRELAADHGADAVLYLGVLRVELERGNSNGLCGITAVTAWSDPPGQPSNVPTKRHAACLYVNLLDLEQRNLYSIRSGLEFYATWADQTRYIRPVEERFTNEAVLRAAIEDGVGPLADRPIADVAPATQEAP